MWSSYNFFNSATSKRRFLRCSVVKSSCSSFIQQKEQVNVVAVLEAQMHIPIAAALAFSAGRVCGASLAYSAQPFRDIAFFGKVFLDLSQHLVGRRTRQAMEPPGECLRFYEYHSVGYTTL
jgi:hypothetical protein